MSKIYNWVVCPCIEKIYLDIISKLQNDDIFIEIGTLHGDSAIFAAQSILYSNKDIRFVTIDTACGSPNAVLGDVNMYEHVYRPNGLTYAGPIADHIFKSGFRDRIIQIVGTSYQSSKLFCDNSIGAVFLDGDHSKDGIALDINSWYRKIKNGGILSGHDYSYPDVFDVVNKYFIGDKLIIYKLPIEVTDNLCWLVYKNG